METDFNDEVRQTGLRLLIQYWNDDQSQALMSSLIYKNGFAAYTHAKKHSSFRAFLFRGNITAGYPYTSPEKPITQKEIQFAARIVRVDVNELFGMVESLSKHMGWDIMKGSGHHAT